MEALRAIQIILNFVLSICLNLVPFIIIIVIVKKLTKAKIDNEMNNNTNSNNDLSLDDTIESSYGTSDYEEDLLGNVSKEDYLGKDERLKGAKRIAGKVSVKGFITVFVLIFLAQMILSVIVNNVN